jgi:hypothetical protein
VLLRLTATAFFCCAALGCGGTERSAATPEAEGLPPYTPADAAVFDDSLAPEVFGMSLDGSAPERDPKLSVRTQEADSVVRAKVSTVTSDRSEAPTYQLVLAPLAAPISGAPVNEPIEVWVTPQSSAYPYVRSADAGLVGKSVVLFFRRFDDRGEAKIHWHAEADTDAIRLAVERAKALEEVR